MKSALRRATHKHPKVRAWLARHPRWTVYFTPTSNAWLDAVETFFSTLTGGASGAATSGCLVAPQAAIKRHLAEHTAEPNRLDA